MNIKGIRVDSGYRKLGAVVGDNAQTGINVSLLPGIKIGSGAWISPGLIVQDDVPSGYFLKNEGSVPRKDMDDK
jgi:bifunctional UDP-N-acetylglucosamine pyrophosphorylase/glucosamine-1-phosphate N-acetyltransferase